MHAGKVRSSWHEAGICKGTWHRHAKASPASPWRLQLQWPRKAHTTSHLKPCQHLLIFLSKAPPPSSTSILCLVLSYSCYLTSFTKSLLSTQLKSKASETTALADFTFYLPQLSRGMSSPPLCYKHSPHSTEARIGGKGRKSKPAWPLVASPSASIIAHDVKRRGKERKGTLHRSAQ